MSKDHTKTFPNSHEAKDIAERHLTDEGWTPHPEHPGHWFDPEGKQFALAYFPAFPANIERAKEIGTVKLLTVRPPDGTRPGFTVLIEFEGE